MFMDDMGYADIGAFGAKDYPTPNLDRMAKEGRKFTDFYNAGICSASRAGLPDAIMYELVYSEH